jgi:YHS domain-containing protein
MMNLRTTQVGAAAVLIAVLLVGCGKGHDNGDAMDHGSDMHKGMEEVGESPLAGLSAEDQKLAAAQKICPVSGEELGAMGTPVKVTAEGQTAFLCCEGCQKKFEREPAKYLAKLDSAGK